MEIIGKTAILLRLIAAAAQLTQWAPRRESSVWEQPRRDNSFVASETEPRNDVD